MDYTMILTWLQTLAPWASYVLMVLGALVVIGTAVDNAIPEATDHNFMSKIFAIPFLGGLLQAIAKFSPFYEKPKA